MSAAALNQEVLKKWKAIIKAIMECLENIKDKTFKILEELQTLYQEQKHTRRQIKVGDKADELIEGEA